MKITTKKEAFGFGTLIQTIRNYFSYRIHVWELYKKRARKEGWKKRIGITISDFFKTHPSNLRRWLIIFRPFGFVQDQSYPFDQQFKLYFISSSFLRKYWSGDDNLEQIEWHYYKPFTIRSYYWEIIGHDSVYPKYEITRHVVRERKLWQKDWRVTETFVNNEAHWLKPYEDYLDSGGLEGSC